MFRNTQPEHSRSRLKYFLCLTWARKSFHFRNEQLLEVLFSRRSCIMLCCLSSAIASLFSFITPTISIIPSRHSPPSARSIKSVCKVGSSPVFRHINRTLNILWLSTTPSSWLHQKQFRKPSRLVHNVENSIIIGTAACFQDCGIFLRNTSDMAQRYSGDIAPRQTIMVDGSDVDSRRS